MLNLVSKLLYLVYLQRLSASIVNAMSKLLYLSYLEIYHVFKTESATMLNLMFKLLVWLFEPEVKRVESSRFTSESKIKSVSLCNEARERMYNMTWCV